MGTKDTRAAARYAEALYLAQPDDTEKVGAALTTLAACMAESPALKSFLFNPSVSLAIRKETARMLLPDNAPETLVHFIWLLFDRKRLSGLPDICAAYHALAAEHRNALDIRVTAAFPLDETMLERIREKYKKRYGAQSANIQQVTDPSLLGGLRVQIGDKVIDDTLRTRLNGLRNTLNEA